MKKNYTIVQQVKSLVITTFQGLIIQQNTTSSKSDSSA